MAAGVIDKSREPALTCDFDGSLACDLPEYVLRKKVKIHRISIIKYIEIAIKRG